MRNNERFLRYALTIATATAFAASVGVVLLAIWPTTAVLAVALALLGGFSAGIVISRYTRRRKAEEATAEVPFEVVALGKSMVGVAAVGLSRIDLARLGYSGRLVALSWVIGWVRRLGDVVGNLGLELRMEKAELDPPSLRTIAENSLEAVNAHMTAFGPLADWQIDSALKEIMDEIMKLCKSFHSEVYKPMVSFAEHPESGTFLDAAGRGCKGIVVSLQRISLDVVRERDKTLRDFVRFLYHA